MTFTKYRTYSNEELLELMEDKRQASPVIEELCQRLEAAGVTCPGCEAPLTREDSE